MNALARQDLRLGWNLLVMQVRDRYLGSSLGATWAIANPLFMLLLYTFIFGSVLRIRLPGAETTFAYALWLIAGYGPWLATVEATTASAHSVVNASGIVKNLAIKTEWLPVAATGVGLITLAVCLLFIIALTLVEGRAPGWTLLWLPLVVAVHFGLLAAIGFWLSAATVFVRDLGLALPNLLTIAMFATPIFYPIESLPPILQRLAQINPFYILVRSYRAILLEQAAPSALGLIFVAVLAAVAGGAGLVVFRRLKGQFGSML